MVYDASSRNRRWCNCSDSVALRGSPFCLRVKIARYPQAPQCGWVARESPHAPRSRHPQRVHHRIEARLPVVRRRASRGVMRGRRMATLRSVCNSGLMHMLLIGPLNRYGTGYASNPPVGAELCCWSRPHAWPASTQSERLDRRPWQGLHLPFRSHRASARLSQSHRYRCASWRRTQVPTVPWNDLVPTQIGRGRNRCRPTLSALQAACEPPGVARECIGVLLRSARQ